VGPLEYFKFKMNPNYRKIIQLQTLASKLKKFEEKFLVTYLEPRNKFDHWSFLKFEMEFENSRNTRATRIFEFYLRYLEISEILETWSKILLLHLVAFKIISRV
jgi:hypothetical protein